MISISQSTHWADIVADQVIRERGGKDSFVCASGITPSGTVHIGNFREIISVELVVRALRQKGFKVRLIYSWDDFDVFRKVPENMPQQNLLSGYLRHAIDRVPDVFGEEESYAAYNEKKLERVLPLLGIEPEYIYQSQKYRQSCYAEGIKTALDSRNILRSQLNAHRTTPLNEDWWPLSVFCTQCSKDTTRVIERRDEYCILYNCESCGNSELLDLRETDAVKLPWRIDWPMRWFYEGVDFEPAGKDHHSEGGSFDTAKLTAREVYGCEPPVTFQYDFVRVKGGSGKISSSSGEVVSLSDVLKFYQPEVVRYLFASTRPNSEFAISFDLDVLKVYEDYDRLERSYFNKPDNPKKHKKWEKDARIYELSQVRDVPKELPFQIQIRHLTTLLQIYSGDIDAVIEYLGGIPEGDRKRFQTKAVCAWNWVNEFAPEDFRFSLRVDSDEVPRFNPNITSAITELGTLALEKLGRIPEKEFSGLMYDIIHQHELESSDFFSAVYTMLICKTQGPRLIKFLHVLGSKTVADLLLQNMD